MGKNTTNLVTALGLITVVFAGYYLYTTNAEPALDFTENDQIQQNMLNNTRVFIQRRQVLDKVTLDIKLFEDQRFNSLRSYTTPILERPIGRPNPFALPNSAPQANLNL